MTENNQSEEKRLKRWRQFDRDEDQLTNLYFAELTDTGSTGCGASPEEILDLMPDRPEGTDPR